MEKGKAAPKTVDEYLAGVPEPARSTLEKVRATIRSAVPKDATEKISYGMPTFDYHGSVVAYGAFKKHCSLFPMSLAVMAQFKDDLGDMATSKGTIQFAQDKPLPAALLKKIVKARLEERAKKKAKA